MITVFVLMLMTGPNQEVTPTNTVFMDIDQCRYYASRLVQTWGNNGGKRENISSRCIPRQAKIVLQ
tara:strand:- start:312 stop:509 length:198 start_codon:yes stop_codon:yes gene_type:complete